ncbi:sensor histidine kinase [Alicyclobacillus macrosporangiidus]|uniref:sensor histidine kinase n=1 Tax=Alicyclobacillus macrosporangiidus TaxID=392015 RepID=UPI00049723C4|nr:sensor histidine kinase [Alicyclobacillus macrosporangiidus]
MTHGELPVFDRIDQGIRILEEERRRIARDLHDGPVQDITNVSMRLEIIQQMIKSDPQLAECELDRLNRRVVRIVNDIRRLIYDLRPVAVDEVGLVKAISELCDSCTQDWKITFQMDVRPDVTDDIAPAKQVAIYRLVQEVFNNVKKHASATRVDVRVFREGAHLIVSIWDDGKGFDPNAIPAGHYGIVGMKERIAYLGGRLDIQSRPGTGSTFTIRVPVYGEK